MFQCTKPPPRKTRSHPLLKNACTPSHLLSLPQCIGQSILRVLFSRCFVLNLPASQRRTPEDFWFPASNFGLLNRKGGRGYPDATEPTISRIEGVNDSKKFIRHGDQRGSEWMTRTSRHRVVRPTISPAANSALTPSKPVFCSGRGVGVAPEEGGGYTPLS